MIWSTEIKELQKLFESFKGQLPDLEKELEPLIKTDDPIVVMLYSRRALEIIVQKICVEKTVKLSQSIPLKGIIDKLNKEEIVPYNIVTAMLNLNSISTFGAHPKDFDKRQVRTSLINLITIIDWYISFKKPIEIIHTDAIEKIPINRFKMSHNAFFKKKSSLLVGIILALSILLSLFFTMSGFFRNDKFSGLRDNTGKISIAVMPFKNLTGNSNLDFWQQGIAEFLINDLANSSELTVLNFQTIFEILEGKQQAYTISATEAMAGEVAKKTGTGMYITGNFIGTENQISIILNLVATGSNDVMWSSRADGSLKSGEYKHLLDSLSNLIRNYLEIKALEGKTSEDFLNAFPHSSEAYRYYVDGLKAIIDQSYVVAVSSLEKSVQLDTTFTFAYFYLAFAYSFSNFYDEYLLGRKNLSWENRFESIRKYVKKAYEFKNRTPSRYHNWINLWYAGYISKNIEDMRTYCELIEKENFRNRFVLLDLGNTYEGYLNDFQKAIEMYKKIEELEKSWGETWKYERYYSDYGRALLRSNFPHEAKKVIEKGLIINPENGILIKALGICNIIVGDSVGVNECSKKLVSLAWKNKAPIGRLEYWLAEMYYYGHSYDSVFTDALNYAIKAHNLAPKAWPTNQLLAEILIKKDIDIDRGLALVEKWLATNPNDQLFLWLKGLALSKKGRKNEALTILKKISFDEYNPDLAQDIREIEVGRPLINK